MLGNLGVPGARFISRVLSSFSSMSVLKLITKKVLGLLFMLAGGLIVLFKDFFIVLVEVLKNYGFEVFTPLCGELLSSRGEIPFLMSIVLGYIGIWVLGFFRIREEHVT